MRIACVTVTVVLMAATAVGQKLAPTVKDVSYGPHERNVLNMWKAQSETPTSSPSPFRGESDFVLKMLKVEQVSPE